MPREESIGRAVLAYLESDGWDCYPEVSAWGRRADLVATRHSVVAVVECKVQMSLSLLDQAIAWHRRAHLVFVAYPKRSRSTGRRSLAEAHILRHFGIGEIVVDLSASPTRVRCEEARFHRVDPSLLGKLRGLLHPDQKLYTPGGVVTSGYSTPWRRTMEAAIRWIGEHPGGTLRQLVDDIGHHYSSDATARSSLRVWLRRDDRVRMEEQGKAIALFPA